MENARKNILHVIGTLLTIFIIVGLPLILCGDFSSLQGEVTAGASVPLPDAPSGEFIVLIKTENHQENLEKWKSFFLNDEDNIVVIFEDITVSVCNNDSTALELAKRYQAYLPVNQMAIKQENSILLVSKVESGLVDFAIFSKEMADYLSLKSSEELVDLTILTVTGE